MYKLSKQILEYRSRVIQIYSDKLYFTKSVKCGIIVVRKYVLQIRN